MNHAILICHPDSQEGQSLRNLMTTQGYETLHTLSAVDAMDALHGRSWSIVLISLDVPVFDRAELLEQLRSTDFQGKIVFYGDSDSPEAVALARTSKHTIVDKPCDMAVIDKLIEDIGEIPDTDDAQAGEPELSGPLPAGQEAPTPEEQRPPNTESPDPGDFDGLKQQISDAIDGLQAKMAAQAEDLLKLRSINSQLAQERDELKAELESFQQEAASMIHEAEKQQLDTQEHLQQAQSRIKELETELDQVLERLEEKASDLRELKAEKQSLKGALLFSIGSLVTNFPDAAVVQNKNGAVVGISRPLSALLNISPRKSIGKPAGDILPAPLNDLLARAADESFEARVELGFNNQDASIPYTVNGCPIKTDAIELQVLFLAQTASKGGGKSLPEGDLDALIEDFKERLFSIRLLTDTMANKAESEKIRAVAKDVTVDVDKLVAQVDKIFSAPESE